jgi:hypothetical protein
MNKLLRLGVVGAFLLLLGVTTLVAQGTQGIQDVVFTAGPSAVPALGGSNGGFAWADLNGDGTQDLFIPPNNVLLNHLTYFAQVASTNTAALSANVNSVGGLFADIDGDGVPDIWSTNNAAPQTGLFYDVGGVYTAPTGTGELAQAGATGSVFAGMAVADIDQSNYLSAAWHGFKQSSWSDSYIYKPGEGIELLKGGPSGFTRIGNGAAPGNLAIDTSRAFETWDVHFLDANNDGYQDLLMPSFRHGYNPFDIMVDSIGARKGSILYLNDGTGKFYVPNATTVGRTLYAIDSMSAGMFYARAIGDTGIIVEDTVRHFNAIGSTFGDLNNDGNMDLILTGTESNNYDGLRRATNIVILYGKGDGTFTFKWNGTNIVDSGLPTSGSIRAWDIGDYNNDQIPDIYGSVTYGIQRLWRGNGNGTYTEVTGQCYVPTQGGRAGGFIDYNNDGFLDLYMYTGLNSVLTKNNGNSNHWIGFIPVGTGHNLSAVGARFTLYTQGSTIKQVRYIKGEGNAAGHGEMRALFGLGINTSIDRVDVLWPDGTTASYTGLAIDRYWTVKEGSAIPGMPSLVYPANDAVSVAKADTLKWDAGTDALEYKVEVSLDPTFKNKALLAVDAAVTGTSYAYSLGPATKYYWRVAAVNGGFKSDYTTANNFTTAGSAAAAVPMVVSPANGNKVLRNTIHNYNAAPVLKFAIPTGMTLADYSSFTFKGYFAQGDVGYKYIVVEAYQTMPTAQFANDTTKKIGSWNRAQMGSTAWEPITVNITNTSALHDTIYIAFGINCAGTGDVGGTGVTTIWYADDVTLVPAPPALSIKRDFEAYSLGDPLAHIGWSPSDIQSEVAKDPVISGATNQAANLTLIVNKTADASRYHWQVSTLQTFATFFANDSTADTTYAVQLNGNQTFYLRVRGANDLGRSAWSAVDMFTTMTPPARTTLVSPANNAQNVISDSVIFVWRPVSTAASYNLQVSTVNSTNTYSTTDTTYKVYNLSRLTNYTWKVEALNAGGTSYYTGSFSFTTVVAAPGTPSLVLPGSAAVNVDRLTRFFWNSVLNGTKYRLQVAIDNAFATVVRDTIVYDTTAVLLTPLDEESDYYWRVNAQNIGGIGGWATFRLFSTGTALGVNELANEIPQVFDLHQNYPNPFNPSTTISFDVPKNAQVKLVIYDILGRVVTTLVDEVKAANRYRVVWDASNMSTGFYFYRMTAKAADGSGDFTSVKKLLLMK